jgi:glutamate formiminotransferase
VRAIGLVLADGRTQVSINVHDPAAVPLARVLSEVRRLAARHGSAPRAAELVGLIPEAALEAYPDDVPLVGFEPERHVIERRLAALRH